MLLTPPRPAPRNSFDDSGDLFQRQFRIQFQWLRQCLHRSSGAGLRASMRSLYGISRPSGGSLSPVFASFSLGNLVFSLPIASISRHRLGYSFSSVQSATCRTLCDRPPQVLVLSEVPDSCLSVGGGRLPPRFKFVQLLFRGVSEDSDVGSCGCPSSYVCQGSHGPFGRPSGLLSPSSPCQSRQSDGGWTSRQPLFM